MHSIVMYEWAPKVKVLLFIRLERLARDKNSSFLNTFITYNTNKVL
jgi:hypothetical protein